MPGTLTLTRELPELTTDELGELLTAVDDRVEVVPADRRPALLRARAAVERRLGEELEA